MLKPKFIGAWGKLLIAYFGLASSLEAGIRFQGRIFPVGAFNLKISPYADRSSTFCVDPLIEVLREKVAVPDDPRRKPVFPVGTFGEVGVMMPDAGFDQYHGIELLRYLIPLIQKDDWNEPVPKFVLSQVKRPTAESKFFVCLLAPGCILEANFEGDQQRATEENAQEAATFMHSAKPMNMHFVDPKEFEERKKAFLAKQPPVRISRRLRLPEYFLPAAGHFIVVRHRIFSGQYWEYLNFIKEFYLQVANFASTRLLATAVAAKFRAEGDPLVDQWAVADEKGESVYINQVMYQMLQKGIAHTLVASIDRFYHPDKDENLIEEEVLSNSRRDLLLAFGPEMGADLYPVLRDAFLFGRANLLIEYLHMILKDTGLQNDL
jgi:hypothetical protein